MAEENRLMSTAAIANREDLSPEATNEGQQQNTAADSPDEDFGKRDATPAPDRPSAEPVAPAKTELLATKEASDFQNRWDETQRGFVDEPRTSVQQADQLVAELMQLLAKGFADERQSLERQWDRGEEVSTEDLRMAMQRYRSFFQRLLAV